MLYLYKVIILVWLPPARCLISLSCLALRMFFNLYVFVICSLYCISTEQHVVEELLYKLLSRTHSKYILPQFGLESVICRGMFSMTSDLIFCIVFQIHNHIKKRQHNTYAKSSDIITLNIFHVLNGKWCALFDSVRKSLL